MPKGPYLKSSKAAGRPKGMKKNKGRASQKMKVRKGRR